MVEPVSQTGRDGEGRLIAFMGIPGSGKSSVSTALAEQLGARSYREPEEASWPAAVTDRRRVGCFTAISWFRSVRVPQLFAAAADRDQGSVAVVDSYYDKLLGQYLDHAGMGWLVPNADRYRGLVESMAALDFELLPNADALVFLRVSKAVWLELIDRRGRAMDAKPVFREVFEAQNAFLEGARFWAENAGAVLVVHDQTIGSPREAATAAHQVLVEMGVFSNDR